MKAPLPQTKSTSSPDLEINEDAYFDTVILGAGPTGLGAAWRLSNHSQDTPTGTCLLLDRAAVPGGKAGSCTTPEGYTFDYGGHVLFPHAEYEAFTELLDRLVKQWHESIPVRGVWSDGALIPTPVQRNIHRLPLKTMARCLWDLSRRRPLQPSSAEPSLQQFLYAQFGSHLTHHIMAPLNYKMWAYHPDTLGSRWSSHRSGSKEPNIPEVKSFSVLRNLLLRRDEPGWNPDSRVRYPLSGGMGAIWSQIFQQLSIPKRLATKVSAIDTATRALHLHDGTTIRYGRLVTSIPLDSFLGMLTDRPDLTARSHELRAARVQIFGFGLEGPIPPMLRGVHAVSVPDPAIPFWRVNIPSNFSPGNVPSTGNAWSLLTESSLPWHSDRQITGEEVEAHLRRIGFLPAETTVVSFNNAAFRHGYPVPFAGRDTLLDHLQRELEALDIYSRGRFGGWRYEVSNQDHAFMQGVEIIDRLHHGTPEYTYRNTWTQPSPA